ncbi:hypothetical protein D3C87_2097520 [compost metagenome]
MTAKAGHSICPMNQTGDQAQFSAICANQIFMAPLCGSTIQTRQPATAIIT